MTELLDIQRRLRTASEKLRSARPDSIGLTTISNGFDALSEEISEEPENYHLEELEIFVELVETYLVIVKGGSGQSRKDELFILFQTEARKRLAGLSISIMGLFGSDEGSIELTMGHLHAIKGSSSMLGLDLISSLTDVMERVALDLETQPMSEKQLALKPFLRSFAILESLIDDPHEGAEVVAKMVRELNILLAGDDPLTIQIDDELLNEFAREHVTDVQVAPLEKRILVVEDEQTIAASIAFVLADLDLPIDIAVDGAAALDKLNHKPYSLVISDIGMPHIDGFALLEAMRSDEQFADIPVILLTGRDNAGFRKRGEELGCQDYIVKGSIGGGALLFRVSRLLEGAPSVPKRESSDASQGRVLLFEESESVASSIAFSLSEAPFDLTLAANRSELFNRLKSSAYDLVIGDDFDEAWIADVRDLSDASLFVLSDNHALSQHGVSVFPRETKSVDLIQSVLEKMNENSDD